jgi:death-on-curing protein
VKEPRWLSRKLVDSIHSGQIHQFGGSPGVRDAGLIESALARPLNKWEYAEERDPCALAAAYGYGLATNHGYVDGNKRIGFLAMYVFLGLNGLELDSPEPEAVRIMLRVAEGACEEPELTDWVRQWARPVDEGEPDSA